MSTDDKRIAQEAIQYLKDHGLTIMTGWKTNGEPPAEVREYLDAYIEGCFPTDEGELEEQVTELIEMDLQLSEE
jgi:hypothetical protein